MGADALHGVAVVTGAASGIGRAIAASLVDAGMRVVLADVGEDRLHETCDALRATGADVIGVPTDVTDPEALERLADRAFDLGDGVGVLCNNAGVAGPAGSPMWELALDEWHRVVDVNFWGVVHGIRAFVPRMIARRAPCHVVNVASMVGFIPRIDVPAYVVSKHAVIGVTETLREQALAGYPSLGVSLLCPGRVATDIVQRERGRLAAIGRADDAYERPVQASHRPEPPLRRRSLAPAAVGAATVEAIRNDTFYVLPNPGSRDEVSAYCAALVENASEEVALDDLEA